MYVCIGVCVSINTHTHHKLHRLACLPHEPRKLHTPSVRKRMFWIHSKKKYPKGFKGVVQKTVK